MRVTVIQHVPFEGPAVIGDVLRDREIKVDVVRMDLDMPVPSTESMDALVVMGGRWARSTTWITLTCRPNVS